MVFSGGLIPTYITVSKTGLVGTIWALIIPGAVPLFNVIVLLNFFRDLPDEIEEAAFLDGANHMTVLFRIYVPLSTAALATVTLNVLINRDFSKLSLEEIQRYAKVADRTAKAAQVFIGAFPVLIAYPFLQRYFTKGLVLGSVKG
jgi:putative aldouronate transport system permease protein